MIRTLMLALLCWSLPVLSQAPATPADTTEQTDTSAGDPPPAPPETGKESAPAPATQSPEDYRPSEEISEDLSVSFPVDI